MATRRKIAPRDLGAAFDDSVTASTLVTPVDAALVEAGRKVARQIDTALASGDPYLATKSLYLVPHLVNILKEMLATPNARLAAGLDRKESAGGKLGQLQAVAGTAKRSAS